MNEWRPGKSSFLTKNGAKTDNHMPVFVQSVHATYQHQTRALGDHKQESERELPEFFQPFEGGPNSTDVPLAVPEPITTASNTTSRGILQRGRPSTEQVGNITSSRTFRKTPIARSAGVRILQGRHAKETAHCRQI